MSTKTLYYCDLCREEKQLDDLIGFEYGSEHMYISTDYIPPDKQKFMEVIRKTMNPAQCARHYCKKCAKMMFNFLQGIQYVFKT